MSQEEWQITHCKSCGDEIHFPHNLDYIPEYCSKCREWKTTHCKICNTTIRYKTYWQNIPEICVECRVQRRQKLEKFDELSPHSSKTSDFSINVEGSDAKDVQEVSLALIRAAKFSETSPTSLTLDNSNPELIPHNIVQVFFLYTREDKTLLDKLEKHLKPLRQLGLSEIWCDISAGTEWKREIREHLNSAQIILLLVSPNFMASDFCYGIEMKRAVKRHERGEAKVIPIILRPVYWQAAPFGKLQALPTGAKPVTSSFWVTQDNALYDITEGIRKVAGQLSIKFSIAPPVTQLVSSSRNPSNSEAEVYLSYCSKCQKKTEMKEAQKTTTKNGKSAVKGICSVCGTNVYLILKAEQKTKDELAVYNIDSIPTDDLRQKIKRALEFLNEENVDVGLFLLSKEFEATLKAYLMKASAKGKLQTFPPGKSPDKWNLNGMVDCAKDNGIITDNAVFHYLRQVRNDRAHGTMPKPKEMQVLMKNAQYLASLYIDYIRLLDDLSQSL